MVDKCLESIYLLDEIEVCMKHVTNISNVTVVQRKKIVTEDRKIDFFFEEKLNYM